MKNIKVLFVCMGNICRSPTAEGVFRKRVDDSSLRDRIIIDSAGTHGYHIGSPPDRRSQEAALKRGINISNLKARSFIAEDFEVFDYILSMDSRNQAILKKSCPDIHQAKLALFLNYASELAEKEVPDPYYGNINGFEYVLDLVEAASDALLEFIRKQHQI